MEGEIILVTGTWRDEKGGRRGSGEECEEGVAGVWLEGGAGMAARGPRGMTKMTWIGDVTCVTSIEGETISGAEMAAGEVGGEGGGGIPTGVPETAKAPTTLVTLSFGVGVGTGVEGAGGA